MALKQQPGLYSRDGSKYGAVTDGSGTMAPLATTASGGTKKAGSQAPDGSIYFTLTDGLGTLA